MATYTDKYKLVKPDATDYVDIMDINQNMDEIDRELGRLADKTTSYVLQWSNDINEDRREENEPVLEKLSKVEDGRYHVVLRNGDREYPLNRREYTAEDGYFYYFGGEMHETYAAAEYVVQYKPANKLEGAEYNLTRRNVVNSQRLEEFDFRPPTTDLVKIYLEDHAKNTDIHVTAAEKAKWNAGTGGAGGSGSAVIQEITLPAADWVQENNAYRLDVPVPGVTSDQYPCISLHPDSVEAAHAADMSPCVQTASGILRFFAGRIPGADLNATAALLSQGAGNSGSYVLPTATATRLGGVRVGENIQVTEDGTVSVDDTHMLDKMSATPEEVQEMLTEVFDS